MTGTSGGEAATGPQEDAGRPRRAQVGRDEPAPSPDALRRRLYRAEATEQDLVRYRQTLRRGARRPATAPLRRTLPHRRMALLLLAGLLTGALVVLTTPQRTAPTTSPARASPGPEPVALTVAADARAAFVRSLEQGRGAGLAQYFFQHPDARPPAVTTLSRAATEEHDGVGTQAVGLAPSDLADHGGRITVMLTLARTARARWRAVRSGAQATADDLRGRRTEQLAGLPVSTTVGYRATAPDRLLIEAAPGVRWDVVVVFSN